MAAFRLGSLLLCVELLAVAVQGEFLNYTGTARTARYWDCCKPSCAWKGKATVNRPVQSCDINDRPIDIEAGTGCKDGGTAYTCNNQQPWAVNDTFSYGFAGAYILPSKLENTWCCACYRLDFTSAPLQGKSMIVQASNTAYDINTENGFVLAIPGGNFTQSNGCHKQYSVSQSVFGAENVGLVNSTQCDNLPSVLQDGCRWRFDWLRDQVTPSVNFQRVTCPTELTSRTGCIRDDETQLAAGSSSASGISPPTTAMTALAIAFASLLWI